jgi:hypothetical protein
MRLFRKLNRLDLLAGTILIVLAIAISVIIMYITWVGISVSLHTANPREQIGPYEILTIKFSQAVRPNDVENQLQSSIDAKLEWQNDRTLHFIPTKPYLGTTTIQLTPGKIGAGGEWLRKDVSWTLTVRQSSIVYMNYGEPKNELMVIPVTGGPSRQLTSTGGKLFDFDVAPSGDTIAYSVFNNQSGFDIWLVDRSGQNPRLLLDCGANRCSSLIWSPDSTSIAYSREQAGPTQNSPNGAPRPWIVNVETAENRPVFSDPQAIGYGALWSPDGNWLVSYNGIAAQIQVVNLKSGQRVLLPSHAGLLGSWSPDSNALVYPDQTTGVNNILKSYLYRADFKTGEISIVLGKGSDPTDYLFGNPALSPSGDQIALSIRSDPNRPDRQLWIVRPDTLGGPMVTEQPDYTYNFYQWDAWGIGLVIQQVNLKKTYTPEIAVWYPLSGYKVIAENGTFPHWLP